MQSRVPLGPGKFHVVVLVLSTILWNKLKFSLNIICEKFQVAALLLLILTLTEPPNTWKSEYLFLGRYRIPLVYLHILKQGPSLKRLGLIFRANNDDIGICKIWRNDSKSPVWITEWNQPIINNQGNWGNVSLVAVVGSRKGFYFKSLNLKKLLLLKK